jgi:membrane carboxypeptidase/penicillin-binding protein PbpC
MDIPFTENDNSLALALGSTEKGCTLTKLLSAYSTFQNEGRYYKYSGERPKNQ